MFQIGDKVRLINGTGRRHLTPGSIYTVSQVDTDSTVKIREDRDQGWLVSSRFELVKRPKGDDERPFAVGDFVYLTDPSKTSQHWLDHDRLEMGIPYPVTGVNSFTISVKSSGIVHMEAAFSRTQNTPATPQPEVLMSVQDVLDRLIELGDPKADPLAYSMKMADFIDQLENKLTDKANGNP